MQKDADQPMHYAKDIKTSYENFIAVCPECDYTNIFNRVSDLEDTRPISSKEVKCLKSECGKTSGIHNDRIQARHLALLYDCYALRREKRYAACVLLSSQALEVFFYHYLEVELLYRPFWKDSVQDTARFNRLLISFRGSIEKCAYGKMRNVFLNWVIHESAVLSLNDAESRISILNGYSKKSPSKEALRKISNQKLSQLLLKLCECEVDICRNKVIHKEAYRPTRQEVDAAVEEVRELLVGLGVHLDVFGSDIYDYR